MSAALDVTFPGPDWETGVPDEWGFSAAKLEAVGQWLQTQASGRKVALGVARNGRLIAEWTQGVSPDQPLGQASAAKSYYSSLLGILVAEGALPSADAKVVDTYPEMMDVPEGEGPKDGRYAFEKDRDITFRQLICNCSGYMKPAEEPGKVFHYQTFGMNILTHAMARAYDLYDSSDPEGLPGCGKLIEDRIRNPIGASWTYHHSNFDLHAGARLHIFGYYTQLAVSLRDQLRAGHLWANWGNWNGVQVIPEAYLKEATVTNPFILENEPEDNWKYGHGFWVNDHARQWPDAPKDSFAASGARAKHTWVCPRLGLVIAQNPGFWDAFGKDERRKTASQNEVISRVVETLTD